ncbi:MAG: hypothetical protein ACYTHK_19160 [Planctomycetota bacterium]|jgi:chromosome segregation ATPase
MKKQDRDTVVGAIESQTERVSLERLAAEGKSHVRIISGETAMSIIETVVNQVVLEQTGVDRKELVKASAERFEKLAREQAESAARIKKLEKQVQERDRRLANARETILSYDAEIQRLADRLKVESKWEELREFISSHGTNKATDLEERFKTAMNEAVERLGKTIRAATASPIDNSVEATDALVARIFDQPEELDSNLGGLDVEVSTDEDGIGASLARLRALRDAVDEQQETAG